MAQREVVYAKPHCRDEHLGGDWARTRPCRLVRCETLVVHRLRPLTSEGRDVSPDRWRQLYARRLWISGLFVLMWVVYGTQIAWFGVSEAHVAMGLDHRIIDLSYWSSLPA